MKHRPLVAFIASLGLAGGAGSAVADDDWDNYMANAAPIMHYSCATLVEDVGEDNDRILEVVKLMVAVSLHNRDIDLTTYDLDDAKKEAIRERFVTLLREGCSNDKNALLAGIVDASVHEVSNK